MKRFLLVAVCLCTQAANAAVTSVITLPAGQNEDVQFNSNHRFGADTGVITYSTVTQTLSVPGLAVSTITIGGDDLGDAFLTTSSATATYLQQSSAAVTYAPISGSTQYIQNTSTPQSATLNVTSGTISNFTSTTGTFTYVFGAALTSSGSFVNVKAYGAVGDGATDNTSAFNAAINAASAMNGAVVYVPNGTYIFTSTAGVVTLPGDDGTCNASYGYTPMTAEATVTMPYQILLKAGVRIVGESYQGTLIKSDWTYGVSTITVSQKILINIEDGTKSNVGVENIRIQDALIGIYHGGVLATSRFKDILIQNTGFPFIIDRSERNEFDHIMSFGNGAGITIGGWWRQRNNAQSETNGGYTDKTVFNRIDSIPARNHSTTEDDLDRFFDTYWFKSENNNTITSSAIAFSDTDPDIITSTHNFFVTAGFEAGQKINVFGSSSNDGEYTIASVAAGTITLSGSDALTNEVIGSSVTVATRLTRPTDGNNSFATFVTYKGIVQTAIAILDRTGRASYSSSIRDLDHHLASRYALYGGPFSMWRIDNVYMESVGIANKSVPDVFGVDYVNPYIASAKLDGLLDMVTYDRGNTLSNIMATNSCATKILNGMDRNVWFGLYEAPAGAPTTVSITSPQPMNSIKRLTLNDANTVDFNNVTLSSMTFSNTGQISLGSSATDTDQVLYITRAGGAATPYQYMDSYSVSAGFSPQIKLRKSHSNTQGTATTTIAGEELGRIEFYGVDSGNNVDKGGSIVFTQSGTAGTRLPTKIDFNTTDGTNNVTPFTIYPSSVVVNASTFTSLGNIYISSGILLNGEPGTSGQFLTSGGAGTVPSWTDATGSFLTTSSATATYLQLSSATATYLKLSSATATYLSSVNAAATYAGLNSSNTLTGVNTFTSTNTFSTTTYLSGGLVNSPSLTFTGDTDMGFYRIGADNLGIVTSGVKALDIGSSQRVGFVDGSSLLPSLTFSGDTNTGIYRPTSDQISLVAGSSDVVTAINSGGTLLTRFGDGTVALPGISFSLDGNSGLYRIGADNLGVAANGSKVVDISTTGIDLRGTNAADSAAAGDYGEYTSSSVVSSNFAATTQYRDLALISLTAGDWDVSCMINATANGATVTNVRFGIGTVAGNDATGLVFGDTAGQMIGPTAASDVSGSVPAVRVSIATTTTYYLKYYGAYSIATPKAGGRISARRVR